MYELNDTIVAVSSPTTAERVIIRLTGPETIKKVSQIFSPPIAKNLPGLISGSIAVDAELKVDATLYMFIAPYSYTGDDVAEIHIHTNASVTEALMCSLLSSTGGGVRMAGPGEFTARSYLNGKIDLAQAEAVGEIVASSNRFQLDAAERLLRGRLAETTVRVCEEMMDCLSLIEAGLDFSQENIEFITRPEVVERLTRIRSQLEQLLAGSIHYESMIDLPAVGIAGAPNAGKSSLLNTLLGRERSIVSAQRKTTRDILTGLLTLTHGSCVLFDCAGLTRCSILDAQLSVLDELAQQAAIEALRNSSIVVFCVDISKSDYDEDVSIRQFIEPNHNVQVLIPVATKSDLLSEKILSERLAELNELFGVAFLVTSTKTSTGVEQLKNTIDMAIIEQAFGSASVESSCRDKPLSESPQISVALTARHRQAVSEAIENVGDSINELKAGNDEVTAMMLRAAYQAVSDIESAGRVDEQILERIFSRFCIGK